MDIILAPNGKVYVEAKMGQYMAVGSGAMNKLGISKDDARKVPNLPKTIISYTEENLKKAINSLGGKTAISSSIKSNPNFKNLDSDQQDALLFIEKTMNTDDTESQKILLDSLEKAKQSADPYFASQIRIAQDALTRNLEANQFDYNSNKNLLETRIKEVEEDLRTKSEDLSIDEKAQLERLKRTYEVDLENLQTGIANAGLTYSTKRQTAESRLAENQRSLVEDTQRQYERNLRDLQTQARRGTKQGQTQLEELKTKYGMSATDILRKYETEIGTKNLPSLPEYGVEPLGNIFGSLAEERRREELSLTEALSNLSNPFDFSKLLS